MLMTCMGFAWTGWPPSLHGPALLFVPTVFLPVGLPCPSETHCTIPTSALVFGGNLFRQIAKIVAFDRIYKLWRQGKPYAIMIFVENLFGNIVSSCTAVGSELNADNLPGVSSYNMIVQ